MKSFNLFTQRYAVGFNFPFYSFFSYVQVCFCACSHMHAHTYILAGTRTHTHTHTRTRMGSAASLVLRPQMCWLTVRHTKAPSVKTPYGNELYCVNIT